MRIIGLDVGTKRIGVALSDPLGWTAQALTVLSRSEMAADIVAILQLVDQYEVTEVLIGLPLNMNGSRGPSAFMAAELGTALIEARPQLLLTYRDERLSTVAAERVLLAADLSRAKRKQLIDKTAAAIVLQGYLESKERR